MGTSRSHRIGNGPRFRSGSIGELTRRNGVWDWSSFRRRELRGISASDFAKRLQVSDRHSMHSRHAERDLQEKSAPRPAADSSRLPSVHASGVPNIRPNRIGLFQPPPAFRPRLRRLCLSQVIAAPNEAAGSPSRRRFVRFVQLVPAWGVTRSGRTIPSAKIERQTPGSPLQLRQIVDPPVHGRLRPLEHRQAGDDPEQDAE